MPDVFHDAQYHSPFITFLKWKLNFLSLIFFFTDFLLKNLKSDSIGYLFSRKKKKKWTFISKRTCNLIFKKFRKVSRVSSKQRMKKAFTLTFSLCELIAYRIVSNASFLSEIPMNSLLCVHLTNQKYWVYQNLWTIFLESEIVRKKWIKIRLLLWRIKNRSYFEYRKSSEVISSCGIRWVTLKSLYIYLYI